VAPCGPGKGSFNKRPYLGLYEHADFSVQRIHLLEVTKDRAQTDTGSVCNARCCRPHLAGADQLDERAYDPGATAAGTLAPTISLACRSRDRRDICLFVFQPLSR
jgi:hypothetical protein